jgi:hypothetical protein
VKAAIGVANKGTKQDPQYTGFAVKAVKLLAQATGEYTRDELKKDSTLGWTKAAQEKIAAAKEAAEGGTGGGNTPPDDGPANAGTDGD